MANYFAPEEDTVNALPARINPNLAAQGRNSVARQSTPNYDSVLEYLGLGQPNTIQQALDHLGLSDKPARMNPNLAAQGRRMNLPARQAPGPLSEFARQAVSLDPQPDQGYGTMAAEMALGFVPGVGQAMAARDIERARRDNDPVGMGMAASSFVPFGKLIGGLKKPMSELITYHGTPHRFPPTANNPLGEFDPMKIGTGEGAQAYGVGAGYLAENPKTAKGYQIQNAYKAFDIGEEAIKRGIPLNASGRGEFSRQANANKGNPIKAAKGLQNANIAARSIPAEDLQKMFADYAERGGGNLYKVDLPDEQIAKMLDFNKPLKDQNPEIQKALQDLVKTDALGRPTGISVDPNMNGQWAYERLAGIRGAKYAAEAMREANIPGIRYLDQGSRHLSNWEVGKANQEGTKWVLKNNEMAPSLWKTFNTKAEADAALKIADPMASGTSNFVVFDPKHMNIIGRE